MKTYNRSIALLAALAVASPSFAAASSADPFTGAPALIGTACLKPKPALHHVMHVALTTFCCGPNGNCAQPIGGATLVIPAMSGHT
jgi:hypothetical protein